MQQLKPQLKSWLLIKPLIFTLLCIGFGVIFGFAYALIQTFLNFESLIPIYALGALAFILSGYYMIKKLPHDKLNQTDFIAIVNGAGIISIVATIIAILMAGIYGGALERDMFVLYILHPTMFYILILLMLVSSLYLIGVALSGVYAKYKRTVSLGVSPWKVILSMPFAFLLMWTPGYLLKGKDVKSNLEIKSDWYNKLNKWVLSNFDNTLFAFALLILFKGLIAGTATLILAIISLIIYTLWYAKHKSDFIKDINKGYVWL